MRVKERNLVLHFYIAVLFLNSSLCLAQYRKPANFVPDDDMILVPIEAEISSYDSYHQKFEDKFVVARKKLNHWQAQEEYAKNYGLEDAGFIDLPTPSEKQKYFEKNYLRFISKDVERKSNESIQETWEDWTADDEIEAIDSIEQSDKVIVYAQKNNKKSAITTKKNIKVGKERFKFGIQPRLEIGMVKVDLKSRFINIRSWLGVNGNQEISFERRFRSTGTKARLNYYIDQSLVLAVLDQKLVGNWSLRFTHTKDINEFEQINETGVTERNVAQIKYHKRF